MSAFTVSPELALVDPELRALAIALFCEPAPNGIPLGPLETPVAGGTARVWLAGDDGGPKIQRRPAALWTVPVYLAGSIITSFVFGVAFVATIAAVVLLVNVLG